MNIFQPTPVRSIRPLKQFGGAIDVAPLPSAASDHRLQESSLQWTRLIIPVAIITLGLISRLWFLQIAQGKSYRQRADINRVRTISIPAPRGNITDIHGTIVAENVPDFELAVIPADVPRDAAGRSRAIQSVAGMAGIPVSEVEHRLKAVPGISTDPVIMRQEIPSQEALDLMVKTQTDAWIMVSATPQRRYPLAEAMGNVLGYVGPVTADDLADNPKLARNRPIGKSGLEQTTNQVLTGQDGYRDVERNVSHQAQRVLAQQEPTAGHDVQLTIDATLQKNLYDALQKSIQQVHSKAGAAVAMDPRTGAVRALVSYPGYDNNAFVAPDKKSDVAKILTDDRRPLLNRPISGQYPSGSIIKPMLAAAGLQEKIVTPSTTVLSTGGITIGKDTFPDWKAGGHGVTNMAKAIAESVNTYFYILGGGDETHTGLGVDRIVKYLGDFGWGEKLGINLPGEASGLLPTKEWRTTHRSSPWRLGDTYHLSIGQGDLLVTPLQVATAVSTVVNNGTVYKPFLINKIVGGEQTAPSVIRHMNIDPQNFAAVRDGMRQGVLSGSSRALGSLPVTTGAKTGTAQFGRDGKTHAWFATFAPYDNPELVIVVIVEGGGEGHAAALPAAQQALQAYFAPPQAAAVDN